MAYLDLKELNKLDFNLDDSDEPLIWESAAKSDIGRVRETNEDAYLCAGEQQIWVVADGMGGHSRGDYASKTVVESLLYFTVQETATKSIMAIDSQLKNAHALCRNTFATEKVGSTVAALHVHGTLCFLVWAGDSRIYRLRDHSLELLTSDHTLAQEKCNRGELSPVMAAIHPSAHILTRAVGINQTLWNEFDYTTAQAGDRYLLCTDGLYNELESNQIQTLLAQGSAQQAVDALVSLALERGGRDNTTAIVLDAKSP